MSKTPKIYKNKKLNNANFNNFTKNDYQIFLSIISKIMRVDKNNQYLSPNKIEREYSLSAKDYSQYFDCNIKNAYRFLKNATDKLMKTDIRLLTPEDNKYWRINICSKAEYIEREGIINIKFTDDIMPYLAQVNKKFMMYNLKEITHFKSVYTIRLYELIQEYKETGWILKSVDQLRDILSENKNFSLYADFKRFTFQKACDEINKLYDLNIKFEEIKEGRKVVSIKFTFNKAKVTKFIDPFTEKPILKFEKPKLLIDPIQEKEKRRLNRKSKSKTLSQNNILDSQMNFNDIPKQQKKHSQSIGSVAKSILKKFSFWNK